MDADGWLDAARVGAVTPSLTMIAHQSLDRCDGCRRPYLAATALSVPDPQARGKKLVCGPLCGCALEAAFRVLNQGHVDERALADARLVVMQVALALKLRTAMEGT